MLPDRATVLAKSLGNKSLALLDVLLELRQASREKFFFFCRDLPNWVNLLDTIDLSKKWSTTCSTVTTNETYTQLNIRREEINALVSKQRALDKRRCDDTLLSVQASQKGVGEFGTCVRH